MNNKQGINPVVAGLAGAAIGAAAGAALANDDIRQKVTDSVMDTKEKGEETYHQITKAAKKTNSKKA